MNKIYWECRACGWTGCSEVLPKKCDRCNGTPVETKPNFIEVESVEQANEIDMEVYRLVNYSDRQGKYIFCRRARK